jgi:hypothetical protein
LDLIPRIEGNQECVMSNNIIHFVFLKDLSSSFLETKLKKGKDRRGTTSWKAVFSTKEDIGLDQQWEQLYPGPTEQGEGTGSINMRGDSNYKVYTLSI